MTSLLTNNSAMIALQNLRQTNNMLTDVQSQIATGKKYATAKDNAAIWSVAAIMDSDVSGFKGVTDALALGESTVAVARSGAEKVVDLLNQMKERIVAAQADNVDRNKIDADVQALKGQIAETVNASQFNGMNLLTGTGTQLDVLSSLNRTNATTVTASNIAVAGQNLEQGTLSAVAAAMTGSTGVNATGSAAAFAIDSTTPAASGNGADLVFDPASLQTGDVITVQVGDESVSYTVTEATPTAAGVGAGVASAISAKGITGLSVDSTTTAGTLGFSTTSTSPVTVSAQVQRNGTAGAGLADLATLEVANGNHATALANIDGLIETATQAAAALGSAQMRIGIQSEFIKDLSDNLKSGIGAIRDTDMESASARLQALQVQQQLGGQALSIANQQPQAILSLFR